MELLAEYVGALALAAVVLFILAVAVIWSLVSSLRGINRSLAEIASQFQMQGAGNSAADPPPLPGITRELPKPTGALRTSVFG